MDSSPPGSSVHGILQARMLEWVAMHAKLLQSCPTLCYPMDGWSCFPHKLGITHVKSDVEQLFIAFIILAMALAKQII